MQTAQRNSLRLLQWMMAASLALPLALFIFASAVSWISINETADREIERSLDVLYFVYDQEIYLGVDEIGARFDKTFLSKNV